MKEKQIYTESYELMLILNSLKSFMSFDWPGDMCHFLNIRIIKSGFSIMMGECLPVHEKTFIDYLYFFSFGTSETKQQTVHMPVHIDSTIQIHKQRWHSYISNQSFFENTFISFNCVEILARFFLYKPEPSPWNQ